MNMAIISMPAVNVCFCTHRRVFTYLGFAQGPWAAVPCWEAPAGGLGRVCQVGRASCPASGAVSFSFPQAPFGFCRSFLPADGSIPPRKENVAREDVTGGYIATVQK